jgi:hypothetical protein
LFEEDEASEKESDPGQDGGHHQREDDGIDDQFDPQGFHQAIHLTVLLYPTSHRMSMTKEGNLVRRPGRGRCGKASEDPAFIQRGGLSFSGDWNPFHRSPREKVFLIS